MDKNAWIYIDNMDEWVNADYTIEIKYYFYTVKYKGEIINEENTAFTLQSAKNIALKHSRKLKIAESEKK
jgi:hypothetical protein